MTVPDISAIVCTRNRPQFARNAVESVLATKDARYELIVVDQSDSGETETVLRPLREKIVYIRTKTRGAASARNLGAAAATGRYLAFTDDDCEVPANWLRTAKESLDETPEAAFCYGSVESPPATNTGGGGVPSMYLQAKRLIGAHHGFELCGMSANMAIRSEVFHLLHGFDEALGTGAPLNSAEEFDLQYRAHRCAFAALLNPSLAVTHYGFRTQAEWKRLYWRDGYGVGAFFMKHVRCGDAFALRKMALFLCREAARSAKGILLHRDSRRWIFLVGIIVGAFRSFRFGIDKETRRYKLVRRGIELVE